MVREGYIRFVKKKEITKTVYVYDNLIRKKVENLLNFPPEIWKRGGTLNITFH